MVISGCSEGSSMLPLPSPCGRKAGRQAGSECANRATATCIRSPCNAPWCQEGTRRGHMWLRLPPQCRTKQAHSQACTHRSAADLCTPAAAAPAGPPNALHTLCPQPPYTHLLPARHALQLHQLAQHVVGVLLVAIRLLAPCRTQQQETSTQPLAGWRRGGAAAQAWTGPGVRPSRLLSARTAILLPLRMLAYCTGC